MIKKPKAALNGNALGVIDQRPICIITEPVLSNLNFSRDPNDVLPQTAAFTETIPGPSAETAVFATLFERKSPMPHEQVKIFSLSTCSHCKSAKKFLNDCTIKYEFVDVDLLEGDERKAILEDVKKFNPKCSFPTIIIGEKVIIGFKEPEIKEALGL